MRGWQRLGWYIALGSLALVYAAPVLFMLASSFTPDERVLDLQGRGALGAFVPREPTAANYADVFRRLDFPRYLVNSLFITATTVLAGLVVNSMAGYALARLRFVGRAAISAVVLALLVIPFEAIAVPLFFLCTQIGWYDSYQAQIVPFIANPFSIYLFATFFAALPRELEEAARLDGAGPWRCYAQIAVPLALPAFGTVAILSFLMHWGSYLWPLMITADPAYRPLPLAIGIFPASQPVQWGDIMAFGTLMVLPVLVVFVLFQRAFVRGLAAGGVKG